MDIDKTFKDQWARRFRDNAERVRSHLNIGSITQFGGRIGADPGTICRWLNYKEQPGHQPAYYLAAIYEVFGQEMLLAMFTGRIENPRHLEKTVGSLNLEQTLQCLQLVKDRLEVLAVGKK